MTLPNSRIFYACQAVLVVDRNTATGDTAPTDGSSKYLTGVQSIGVNTTTPSSSLLDVGRFQQSFHYYDQQEIEITIERVIDKNSNFFYNVSTDPVANYQNGYDTAHMFYKDNINVQGSEAGGICLKNYDITLIYSSDGLSRVGVDRYNSSEADDKERNKCIVATYRNCLLTNISYTISVDGGIREAVTLFTRFCDMHEDRSEPYTLKDFVGVDDEGDLDQLPTADTPSGPGTPQSGDTVKGYDIKFRPPSLSRYKVGTKDNPAYDPVSNPLVPQTIAAQVLRRQNSSDSSYFSILPDEVELMFGLSDDYHQTTFSLDGQMITGINSITIGVSIDYSEITDVGRWTGSDTGLSGLRDSPSEGPENQAYLWPWPEEGDDPTTRFPEGDETIIDPESATFYGQGLQNLWRFVSLPVAVTASFTGTARQNFPGTMKNGSSLFTKAADFRDNLAVPSGVRMGKEARWSGDVRRLSEKTPGTASDWNRVDRPILITGSKILADFPLAPRYFVWDLGEHNYLTDISTSGGDAEGGNVEVTMSYQNDYSEAVFAKHSSVIDLSSSYDGPY